MPKPPAYPDIVADIGALFGLSRPASQCFASIWRSAQPPCADDLTEQLDLSRSNVSTALKELRDWGLIARARAPGDRKDYYTAESDPWENARLIMLARQRRSIAPILDRLLTAEAATGDARIAALHEALSAVSTHMEALANLEMSALETWFRTVPREPAVAEKPATDKKKKKKRKA